MGVVAKANIMLEHVDQVLQDGGNLNERDRGHGVVGNLHGNQVVHPPSNIKATFLPFMEIHLKWWNKCQCYAEQNGPYKQ